MILKTKKMNLYVEKIKVFHQAFKMKQLKTQRPINRPHCRTG